MHEREIALNTVLFDLLQARAQLDNWKDPFEVKFRLASKRTEDKPISKDAVRPIAKMLTEAIAWFHGAAVVVDVESMTSRPAPHGEPAAYWFFDGYELTVGSTGYQG